MDYRVQCELDSGDGCVARPTRSLLDGLGVPPPEYFDTLFYELREEAGIPIMKQDRT
jgi:hypothetical protein